MYGRTDIEKYKNALRTSINGIPLVEGGWTRRPGTRYVAPVKNAAEAPRLQRFEFSTTQAYILEFGDEYLRIYKDNGPVLEASKSITAITQANPAVVTSAGHGYANGDEVEITGVVGMTEVNNRRFTVANAAANTFELSGVDSTSYGAYSSGGTVARVYTVTTPWAIEDVFQLKFTQSADVLYVAHPSYQQRSISRTDHTAWSIDTIAFSDGPYLPVNSGATTLGLSVTTGSVTVTASADTFASTDVGRLIRWKDAAGNWTWLEITAFTDATHVTATIKGADASATTATAFWRLGVWSDTTGYPAAVTFFEDRLFWGGATSYPQRLDGSRSGDYTNMAPSDADGTVAADHALSFTLNASDVNVIRWMHGDEKGLLVGTVGGEWIVRPSAQSEALSPTNISAKQSTSKGSADIAPVRAGKALLFVQKSTRKVHELAYLYEVDGFTAPEMTLLSRHVTLNGIKQIAYQQDPQSVAWAVRNDGVLLGFTYEREQNVVGWVRHILGGWSNAGKTERAKVESIAVIPSPDGTRDEVWLVVQRYINGATVRYVEYITKIWEDGDEQVDAFFLDCGLTYDSSATTTIKGLFHLAGETVQVLRDGMTHPDVTVSSTGTITLTKSGSVVHIGYHYDSDGEQMNIDAGSTNGTSQGKTQKIHYCAFRFFDSLGFKFGPDADHLTEIFFRTSADAMGEAVPLFTGDKGQRFEGTNTDNGARVYWRFYQPLPGTLLAIMPQIETQDAR